MVECGAGEGERVGSVGQQQKDKISTKKTGEGGGGGKYPETIIYTHAQLDLTGEQKPVAKIPSFTEHAVSAFCYRKKRSAMIRLLGMRLMTRLLLVVCSLSLISILFLSRCGLNTLEPETEEQDGGQAQSELAGNAISLILSYNPSVSSSDFCGFSAIYGVLTVILFEERFVVVQILIAHVYIASTNKRTNKQTEKGKTFPFRLVSAADTQKLYLTRFAIYNSNRGEPRASPGPFYPDACPLKFLADVFGVELLSRAYIVKWEKFAYSRISLLFPELVRVRSERINATDVRR